jgi:single-stranded-DNA-specific exonuclease
VVRALKEASAHLNKFGGHPAAAGFEVSPDKVFDFEKSLIESLQSSRESVPQQLYDLTVDFHGVQQFMKSWDELEPFGQHFEAPVFQILNLKLQKVSVMKNLHLKATFRDSAGYLMECVWFFPQEIDFFKQKEDKEFSILCEPQWNEFMGSRRIQILLKDIQVMA